MPSIAHILCKFGIYQPNARYFVNLFDQELMNVNASQNEFSPAHKQLMSNPEVSG
jgi:hypothetical protein